MAAPCMGIHVKRKALDHDPRTIASVLYMRSAGRFSGHLDAKRKALST